MPSMPSKPKIKAVLEAHSHAALTHKDVAVVFKPLPDLGGGFKEMALS